MDGGGDAGLVVEASPMTGWVEDIFSLVPFSGVAGVSEMDGAEGDD